MAEVGKNIKNLRKEKNLTQDELAERLHCTRQTISNYENGKSEPNIALLVEIANLLETEVNDLIYGPKKKENRKRQKVWAVAALVAAGALQIVISVLTPFAKEYQWRNFELAPIYMLRYVLRPFMLVLFGWGMAQAGKAFAGIRIWEGRKERTVRIVRIFFYAFAVCLTVFGVLTLWTGADMVYGWYLSERMMRLEGVFDSSSVAHLMPWWLQGMFLQAIVYCGNSLDAICLFWGAVLGLCRTDKEEYEAAA
ncbi:MAG: helix-turn-helix domain-containing protein [Lachnospiraceae bacterium]|nr:helix-turn-helix domain-containing protein [Lachnospiraceae bacterium]